LGKNDKVHENHRCSQIVHFSATSQTDPPSPPKNCCVNSAPLRCQYIIPLCLEWLDPHRCILFIIEGKSKSRPQVLKKVWLTLMSQKNCMVN
jgi:hypothetical protein